MTPRTAAEALDDADDGEQFIAVLDALLAGLRTSD